MDVHSLSAFQLLELYAQPVLLSLHSKDPPISGNVYTIDPESRFIGLIQFNENKMSNLLLVPGDIIRFVEKLSFDNKHQAIDQCAQHHAILDPEKAQKYLDQLFRVDESTQNKTSLNAQSLQRYNKIVELLKQRQVAFTEEDDPTNDLEQKAIVVGGAVKIIWPYTEKTLVSTNQNALRRISALLKTLFEDKF